MPETIPHGARGRRLRLLEGAEAVEAAARASDNAGEVFRLAVDCATRAGGRPALNRAGTLRLDQAELFLLSLDTEMLTADTPRAAYLLGIAELHLAGLIELVRAVTR